MEQRGWLGLTGKILGVTGSRIGGESGARRGGVTHHGAAQALPPAALLALEVLPPELRLVPAEVAAAAVGQAQAGLAGPAPPAAPAPRPPLMAESGGHPPPQKKNTPSN